MIGAKRFGDKKGVIHTRRVLLLGLAVGVGALLASSLPDIKRYIKISMM